MIDRTTLLSLVPHQGAMCLWDEVTAWDASSIALRSAGHRDPAHPLRADERPAELEPWCLQVARAAEQLVHGVEDLLVGHRLDPAAGVIARGLGLAGQRLKLLS